MSIYGTTKQSSPILGAISQGEKENDFPRGVGASQTGVSHSSEIEVEEIYRVVPGLPEWAASNCGNVRWKSSLKAKFGSISRCGYRGVTAYYGSNKTLPKQYKVHRLVALAWVPNPNNHNEVNHINGNKLDNRPANLEWCSRSHNISHCYSTGLRKLGQKITAVEAREIFKRAHSGERTNALAKEFGIAPTTVSSIKSRHIWKTTNP